MRRANLRLYLSYLCIINLAHDKIVGGWLFEGRYYFDSVRVFDEAKKIEAFAFAIENEQLAVYVLSEQLTININK